MFLLVAASEKDYGHKEFRVSNNILKCLFKNRSDSNPSACPEIVNSSTKIIEEKIFDLFPERSSQKEPGLESSVAIRMDHPSDPTAPEHFI